MGRDHPLFATPAGRVAFQRRTGGRTYISVEPLG
jgi:ribosomal protein L27